MKKRKIYVVGGALDYANWCQAEIVGSIEEADLVLFTGGEDVDPKMYGEPKNPHTGCNINRDLKEKKCFEKARELKKHIIGICRGSQFVCVMNGGRLVQHQEPQSYLHMMETHDKKVIQVTSSHHQAQYPFNLEKKDYKILGWTYNLSKYHQDGSGKEMFPEKECEIVYYPKTKSLGLQMHPEWMDSQSESVIHFQKLLDQHMADKVL
jgi:gamma-glutamyl-gamma-aminobutyrate hydrolase PuuD